MLLWLSLGLRLIWNRDISSGCNVIVSSNSFCFVSLKFNFVCIAVAMRDPMRDTDSIQAYLKLYHQLETYPEIGVMPGKLQIGVNLQFSLVSFIYLRNKETQQSIQFIV